MARIALIGTRGVPARYGGFESAVEEVGQRLARRGHDVVVYCRNDGQAITSYLGMKLVNLPALRWKYTETLSHTALSILHTIFQSVDVAIVFNAANAPFLPWLRIRGIPAAVHVDGLEWRRAKWSGAGRRYYLRAERTAVRQADRLIADARGIQNYYRERYNAQTTYIPYGAPIRRHPGSRMLKALGVERHGYHLVVARMEPENNVDMIVEGFARSEAKLPLIVVGSAPYAESYVGRVRALAGDKDVRFVGSIWDQVLLDQLYGNTRLYLHGHSVGGTNPSLLRAMGAGAPVAALDVGFNREVLGETGMYFNEPAKLAPLLIEAERDPVTMAASGLAGQARVEQRYDWDRVAAQYDQLCRDLTNGDQTPSVEEKNWLPQPVRRTGRRLGDAALLRR